MGKIRRYFDLKYNYKYKETYKQEKNQKVPPKVKDGYYMTQQLPS